MLRLLASISMKYFKYCRFKFFFFDNFVRKTGVTEEQIGTASVVDATDYSKFLASFQVGPLVVNYDYWLVIAKLYLDLIQCCLIICSYYRVIDTNYSYSLVYSCRITLGRKTEYAWILSRTPSLDPAIVSSLKAKLSANGINVALFSTVAQNC